ncbi:MAG: oxygen-independent coproporphyrinogen III oxidase-like protein [Gammaproteobacteria bacterium]|nr:oxygen-independent coproporphyrinogen III oxidase-like protein [Gammaproteobacteria bacterium]NIR59137.1 oxygen-independent coproporphyrinogen III oxidase-like protein [Gammaproteobacteria bacterium]
MFHLDALPPLALYVHIPWCARKCPYCDFNSHALRGALPEAAYVDALLADLETESPWARGRRVRSVFIGGGTPSLLTPEAIDRLLSGVRARLAVSADAEITLEANPGTVERMRFGELRAAGVNRLSIGVQSFDDRLLERIGRIHTGADARRAAEAAVAAGFEQFNLDLMYGLPGQDPAQALADTEAACALEAPHVSHYQLTLEPHTALHRAPPRLPDEEAAWAMQLRCQRRLAEAGRRQYEVSAYAREGARCEHNLNYWTFGDYLGVGAGAHGKLTDAAGGRILRRRRIAHPARYLQAARDRGFVAEQRELGPEDAVVEFMMNALRLTEGFEIDLFHRRTGLGPERLEPALGRAAALGLIERSAGRLVPTTDGRRLLDDLVALFLPQPSANARLAAPTAGNPSA